MYELEIETKNTLKKIKNPRKARIKDFVFVNILQVMDNDGKWHNVCCSSYIGETNKRLVIYDIDAAIRKRKKLVYVDI